MSNKSFETLSETEVLELIPRTFSALDHASEIGSVRDIVIMKMGLEKLIDRLIELLLTTDGKEN
jgi:hypothetical protein